MEWLEIRVTTESEVIEGIANIFHELGAGGVVIEDPQLIAYYTQKGQWDDHEFSEEILEKQEVVVKGYLPIDEHLLQKLEELKQELQQIGSRMGNVPIKINANEVQEEDWANSWKAYFKPERIGKRTVIKPSWEEYSSQEGDLIIELDPGMAFGTGNHATTALCIKLLEKYVQKGMEVFDVGTGSGILSILAAKLGADFVQAFDYDTVAIKAARDNVSLNNLENKIEVKESDLLREAVGSADLVVANIIADIIIKLIPQVSLKLRERGIFISSGIIQERQVEVLKVLAEYGFTVLEIKEQEGWVAIVAQK